MVYDVTTQAGVSLTPVNDYLWTAHWRLILCNGAVQWFDTFNVVTNETTCNKNY